MAIYDSICSTRMWAVRQVVARRNNVLVPQLNRKHRVAVLFGYVGDKYHGSQYQNDILPTIEHALFKAMGEAGAISVRNAECFTHNKFKLTSRTDKGVHAQCNVISLKMQLQYPHLVDRINEKLPADVRIWNIQLVNKNFNAKDACSSRLYEYILPAYSLMDVAMDTHDQQSLQVWSRVQEMANQRFTSEQLAKLEEYVHYRPQQDPDSKSIYEQYLQIIQQNLHTYETSAKQLQMFEDSMKQFIGTHNFHNYSSKSNQIKNAVGSIRYIKDIKVSKPFNVPCCAYKLISVQIHGQSFMLNQIRKMLAMAIISTKRSSGPQRIIESLTEDCELNIVNAPASGLLLKWPLFDGYNKKLVSLKYPSLTPMDSKTQEFYHTQIIPTILSHDLDMVGFLLRLRNDGLPVI